jgi:uncharacterized protein (UPF0332 family)
VTNENRRTNIRDEVRRAGESEQAAEALVQLGLVADAASRVYYMLYHWVRALLLSRGLEPRSHSGAIHLFNVELVRTGLMDTSSNRLLSGLQRLRELADYDASLVLSAQDVRQELERARAPSLVSRRGQAQPDSTRSCTEPLSGPTWRAPRVAGGHGPTLRSGGLLRAAPAHGCSSRNVALAATIAACRAGSMRA